MLHGICLASATSNMCESQCAVSIPLRGLIKHKRKAAVHKMIRCSYPLRGLIEHKYVRVGSAGARPAGWRRLLAARRQPAQIADHCAFWDFGGVKTTAIDAHDAVIPRGGLIEHDYARESSNKLVDPPGGSLNTTIRSGEVEVLIVLAQGLGPRLPRRRLLFESVERTQSCKEIRCTASAWLAQQLFK